jgi:hypothetical protein
MTPTVTVATVDELRRALARARQQDGPCFPAVYLEYGEAQLIVGFSREREHGTLYWSADPNAPSYVPADGDNEHSEVYGLNEILMPPHTEIPIEQVMNAAEQFFVTGQQPSSMNWVDYDTACRALRTLG